MSEVILGSKSIGWLLHHRMGTHNLVWEGADAGRDHHVFLVLETTRSGPVPVSARDYLLEE